MRPHHVVEQLHVFDGVRELTPQLVGAIQQIELAAGFHAHAVEHDRAERTTASAQRNRHGPRRRSAEHRENLGTGAPHRGGGRRERVVGAHVNASREMLRIRRAAQNQVARAPVVDPDRGSIGAEKAVGAMTENVETRRQVERGRETGGELVDELAQIALELVSLPETEELERSDEGVGDRGGVAGGRHGHRGRPESDRKQSGALRAGGERHQQRRGRRARRSVNSGICRSASATNVGPCRAKASDTSLCSGGPGIHGSVTSSSSPKPDVACMMPLPGSNSNSSEQVPWVASSAC